MSDPVNELLRQFAAQPSLLLQVLLCLLENAAHADHPAITSLCDNLPQLLLSIYNVHDIARQSMQAWTMSMTEKIFSAELTALSCEEAGLHFNAKNATAENLESFSIRKLAKTMEETAPFFWSFLDTCLNADTELVKDRETYAVKKEKRVGLNQESGSEHEPTEGDVYHAEFGVIDELEDTSPTAPMKSLRSQRECLQTIKKVTLTSIITKSTNQKCNAFASVIGLFAHSSRAPERLIETLAHAGLSISVNAINEAVTSLSKEADTKLRALGESLAVSYAYDNFDVTMDVATPTAEGGGSTLAHLTSGTVLKLEHGVTAEDLACSEDIWKTSVFNLKKSPEPKCDMIDLLSLHPDEDHPSGLTRRQRFQAWQFRHDLVLYGPEYFRQFEGELGEPEAIEQVPMSKACQVPASAMDINQSTTKGNIDAIEHLLRQTNTGDPQERPGVTDMTKHVILVHGDLSTMERIQSAQASRALEQTPWRRFQYVVFIPGLFHVKMACADALWRVLIEPGQSRVDASSTMELAGVFRPQQTGKIGSNPGFRLMHDLIQQDGLARRLDCWRIEVQKRRPGIVDLTQYSESKPSWNELCSISNVLAVEFVAQGSFSRRQRAPETRDADFENSLLRNQYYLLYEEITHAMNSGDIGRVEDILATWILLFKGCGKMKYSAQMARFLTDLHFVYPERLRRAIRLNWLCNPRGKAGMFRGIDWLVERNNLYTKYIYGGSFSARTIPYIIKESVLIELYRKLHVNIEDNFCLTNRTIHHTPADLTSTLAKASSWIQKADPHRFQASKTVKYDIIDAVRKGSALLMVGDINTMPADEEEAVAEDNGMVLENMVQGGDLAV